MQFNTISHTNEIAPLLSIGRRFPSLYFFKQLLRLRTNASTSGGPILVPLSVPRRCAATRTRGPRGGRSPAGATLFPRDPAGGRGGSKKADQADCAPPPPGRSSQRSRAGLPSRSDNLDAAAGRKKKLKAIKRRAHKTREKATTPLARAENTFRPPRRGSSSSSSSSRFLEENGPLARSRKSSRDPNKESSRESSGRAPPRNKTEGRKERTTNNSAERRRKTEGREQVGRAG